MRYNANSQSKIILLIAFIGIIVSVFNWNVISIKLLSLIILIICLLFAFIKYTLIINNQTVVYIIQLLGVTIYSKEILPSEINKIIFKRIGWNKKLAYIKLKRGLSIRVTLFKPENVYDDLATFCEKNTIHYEKTKDYKIIKKMR